MRRILAAVTLTLAAGCGSAPTEQEENLSQRGEGAEQMPAAGNEIPPGTLPPAEQNMTGDTMPEKPAGPTSDRASGTGGDTVPSQ